MKKTRVAKAALILAAVACTVSAAAIAGCKKKPDNSNNNNNGGGFSYYENTKLASDKKVYALNYGGGISSDSLNTLSAMQGLFARKQITFYIDGKYITNGTNADQYYLNDAISNYGVNKEEISLATAVSMYKDAWNSMVDAGIWGSNIDIANGFKDSTGSYNAYTETSGEGYSTPGFILYDPATYSVNIASTLAGITGFLPVAYEEKADYEALGLVEKMNVRSATWNYRWCFNACMTELSGKGLIHQDYDLNGKTNFYIRDYGVANKYMHVYYDNSMTINATLKKQIHNFLDKNIPILGYAADEVPDVALFSEYGQFLVPTDYTMNLTFHLAETFNKSEGFKQPNSDKDKAAEQGKHYVAFVVSDGDNAQYWQNTAIFSTSYMNATGREKDDFAVTWSITPSLADMMPLVLNAAYNGGITTKNDYFCAPVSGQGYIDAGNFYNAGAEYMNNFLGNLDTYLTRSDLGVTTIIGAENYNDGGIYGTLDAYADVPSLEGGLVLNGNKYFGGDYSGGVYWKNGKPFIVPRDSLWNTTPAYIAARINMYAATETGHNITDIDAYTVVNVHPWSHNYADIRTIVGMLADNVEVVSLDRIVAMMKDNVADTSDSSEFNRPVSGDGSTITEDDLKKDPSLIPTNPLFNDFLLWAEDWTGSGVTFCSSDAATSDVYPAFKTNIQIAGNSTANKAEFILPDVDDVWVTFYARANTLAPTARTRFTIKMTVDGVEKTVITEAELRGVSGTETAIVTGDGWQTFTFPLKQYFCDYKGKKATASISVLGAVSIKLDRFTVTDRFIVEGDDTVCENPYSNEFENGSTEDWLLGDVFETSQYHSWAAINRNTLQPAGKLEVDSSDGGGKEKRNGNVNVWFAKNITLRESDTKLSLNVSGGAKSKLAMYVDGRYISVYEWKQSKTVGAAEFNLAELCAAKGINSLAGKNVTFVFEVRDNADNDDGVEQDYYLDYFRISGNK